LTRVPLAGREAAQQYDWLKMATDVGRGAAQAGNTFRIEKS